MAVDMVCGMIVDEKSAPAKATYGGDDYHFCATYCRDVFNKAPEKFINGVKQWGKATDPVCGMQIDIAYAAAMSIHGEGQRDLRSVAGSNDRSGRHRQGFGI